MNQRVRNALDDLETAANRVEADMDDDFDAEVIRESVEAIRDELGEVDK